MVGLTETTRSGGEKRRMWVWLILASSLFATGCGSSVEQAVEQTTEQTFEVDSTGTFSIRNAAGAVRIYGSDDANMVVKTTKKGWSSEQVNAMTAKVSVQTKSVSIETVFPPEKTWRFSHRSGSVDCAITLPRTMKITRLEVGNGEVLVEGIRGGVRADLVNGDLSARDCFGDIQLSVANGGLNLFYEKWEQGVFTADTRVINGTTRAFLPRRASFHLVAETADGHVSNFLTEAKGKDSERATKVNMSIGSDPHPEISLRATKGNIEIAAPRTEL